MKRITSCLVASFLAISTYAQQALPGYNQAMINPRLLDIAYRWDAHWIGIPDEVNSQYGVYHFRKSIELGQKPESFIVHVSADNRYKFYVNGHLVSLGPARCDILNWHYETIDIAPWLHEGKNVLAALVWNGGDDKPVAQISFGRTEFLLQGNGEAESVVNTDKSWLCLTDRAWSPVKTQVLGWLAVGAQDCLNAAEYPWGWLDADYDDTSWAPVRQGWNAAPKGYRNYSQRHMVPSPIPPMEYRGERMKLRKAEGITVPSGFTEGKASLTIPANTKVSLLLDNGVLTNGYPFVSFSKGRDAHIEMSYAESLYEWAESAKAFSKGNRDDIEGKTFIGYRDRIIADGGQDRSFETLWWRTWRYMKVDIQTKDESLVINDICSTFTGYPLKFESSFSAPGHDELSKMLEIGWRTARLCAGETYMDCPYYEQLQYFGDSRIQAMITLYNTRDDCMPLNLIEHGRQSMLPDGTTASRYPQNATQIQSIPSYSLSWTGTIYDYWMHRGGEDYLRTLLPQMRSVISWYERFLRDDFSLSRIPFWFFADWPEEFDFGEPIRETEGNSAYQDLVYILALQEYVQMERAFGSKAFADHYAKIEERMRASIIAKYWDDGRGLFADTFKHDSFSQHVNSLAVLAGIADGDKAAEVMHRTLAAKDMIKVTIYYSYYMHLAMEKAGLGNEYLDNLDILRDQMALGLTTWAEKPEPSRSDCHAWGASPNIFFYKFILGINSDAPGFSKVRINPNLCGLKEVSGSIPCPQGTISVKYSTDRKGRLSAEIDLPDGMSGIFIWKGKEYPLHPGHNDIYPYKSHD